MPDVRTAFLDDMFDKVEDGEVTFLTMSGWTNDNYSRPHLSEWPTGVIALQSLGRATPSGVARAGPHRM